MESDASENKSRRQLLGLGAAAATAVAGVGVIRAAPAAADDGDPVLLAATNEANNPTVIEIVNSGQPGLHVISRSDSGSIMGENNSSDGYGVSAYGAAIGLNAVGGERGVYAVSDYGIGMYALTYNGVAVEASTAVDAGYALRVDGAVHFARSGRATVPAGSKSVVVSAAVRLHSTAMATLQTRQNGVAIEAAVPDPTAGTLTIWLNRAARAPLDVAWLLLD
ncbi:MAG: hypothetical protein ABI586_02730 [Candidatus Nanopelagicales bacterium]